MSIKAQHSKNLETEAIPTIVYAAKSSPDEKDSTADQVKRIREAMEPGRFEVAPNPFTEENETAFRGERGDELQAAIRAAVAAATEHGGAELWVYHSSRLARGDGTRKRRSLLKIYADLLYEGVTLRSVKDDDFVRNGVLVGIASDQNHKFSADLSAHVQRGKRQAFERGDLGGGTVPDGFEIVRSVDPHGKVRRAARLDPKRTPIIRKIFDLAVEGFGDPSISRELNRLGHRTRGRKGSPGIAWTRRRIQDTLTNAVYAGAVVWRRGREDEEVNWDGTSYAAAPEHPALVPRSLFERLLAERADRDKAKGSNRTPKGRPHSNHALARLARCELCDAPMRPVTSSYKRKDGTRRRTYLCANVFEGTGLCDAPSIDAAAVDRHVVVELERYLGDIERWRDQFLAEHELERASLDRQAEHAHTDLAGVDRKVASLEAIVERHLDAGDTTRADAALGILAKRKSDRIRAERRVAAIDDAITSLPVEPSTDAMLDFYNELSEAVRGRLDRAGRDSMARVNEALRELFEAFYLDPYPTAHPEGVVIFPVLKGWDQTSAQTFYSVATGNDEITPPLRLIRAPSAKVTTDQA